jgi:protein-S-isoprenylcysteine O-methyltransferase Ste14
MESCNPIAFFGTNFMTETQVGSPAIPGNRSVRFTAFLFGVVAYLTLLFTIMYAIGFISGLAVPSTHVLCTSLTMLLLFWQWRPMPAAIWDVHSKGET